WRRNRGTRPTPGGGTPAPQWSGRHSASSSRDATRSRSSTSAAALAGSRSGSRRSVTTSRSSTPVPTRWPSSTAGRRRPAWRNGWWECRATSRPFRDWSPSAVWTSSSATACSSGSRTTPGRCARWPACCAAAGPSASSSTSGTPRWWHGQWPVTSGRPERSSPADRRVGRPATPAGTCTASPWRRPPGCSTTPASPGSSSTGCASSATWSPARWWTSSRAQRPRWPSSSTPCPSCRSTTRSRPSSTCSRPVP
ncbi:MAG: S-adenosylmethionine-dependent methyltransferase, partial [uncultured Nocardioidaceae bacterium]